MKTLRSLSVPNTRKPSGEDFSNLSPVEPSTDWRRWYVMLMYALSSFIVQLGFYNYSPIASSLNRVFGWGTEIIASLQLVNWLCFICFVFPVSWLVNRYGVRPYLLAANIAVSIGCIIRCIPFSSSYGTITAIQIQNLLTSIGGSGGMMVSPVITSQWFPQEEWRLATSIGMFLQILGGTVAFKLGPAIVPSPDDAPDDVIKQRIYDYFYGLAAVSITVCLWSIIYLPSKPSRPPSHVALARDQENTMPIRQGIIMLVRNWRFWTLLGRAMLVGSMSVVAGCLLFPFLETLGISQDYASTIGFAQSLISIPLAIGMGKLGDYFKNDIKSIVLACTLLALEGATWLFLMGRRLLPISNRSVFFATTLYMVFGGSTLGLVIELGCDCLYPIPEAYVASSIMFLSANIGVLFSALMMVPNLGSDGIDYVVFIFTIVGTISAFFLPKNYARSKAESEAKAIAQQKSRFISKF